MSARWDKSWKAVTAYPPKLHAPDVVSPRGANGFVPPAPTPELHIDRLSLIAAMARTALMSGASPQLMRAQALGAAASIDWCVDDDSAGLVLSPDVAQLNGSERTAFAGRVGAGVCDLYIQSLKYVWRDQASRLIRTRQPLADFIYEGGATKGGGVAIAEAKGTTQRRTPARTQALVDAAYLRQVDKHLGVETIAGEVLHGYAVGLTAALGRAAYLCVAETAVSSTAGPDPDGSVATRDRTVNPNLVSPSTALGNYATALWLAGFWELSVQLRLVRAGHESPSVVARALRQLSKQRDGRNLVTNRLRGTNALGEVGFAVRFEPLLALAEQLPTLTPRRGATTHFELPIMTSAGGAAPDESFVQFADGLAAFQQQRKESIAQAMSHILSPSEKGRIPQVEVERISAISEPDETAEPVKQALLARQLQYRSSS